MVTMRNTKGPPGQAPVIASMVNDIRQDCCRILKLLDNIEAETAAPIATSSSIPSSKHAPVHAAIPESSNYLQRHADYNIHDNIHSCPSSDGGKLGHEVKAKTTTKGKGKRKRMTEVTASEPTLTESKSQHDIRLAKEKGFKILRLIINFHDAGTNVKEGMILPIRDDCENVTRTVTSIILRGYTGSLCPLPDGSLDFKLNVTYTAAPNDVYHPDRLEFMVNLRGEHGNPTNAAPGNLCINQIWSSLSSEDFFFSHDRLVDAVNRKPPPGDLEFSKFLNGSSRSNSLAIRSTPATLSAMETKYQTPTVIDEQDDIQLQPSHTTCTPVNTRSANDESLKSSTGENTYPDTREADKAQHQTTTTCSSRRLHSESQQPHESSLAVDQVQSQISSAPPDSPTRLSNIPPHNPLPENWHWGKDNNSKTYFYNDKIDIAMYKDPRTIQHPNSREFILVPATSTGHWSWEIAKDDADLPLWSHPAGIFCIFPPSESTEKAMSREAIRTAKGGLSHSMRKLWLQENSTASSLSPQPKALSMTPEQLLDRLERALDIGSSRIPLPENWHSEVDGSSRDYFYNDKIDVATFTDPRTIMFADRRESILDNVSYETAWQMYEAVDGITLWFHSDGVWCLEPPWLSTEEVECKESQRAVEGGLSSTKRRMISERSEMALDSW